MSYDGKILAEYIQGDFKLSMWIPSDLGTLMIQKMSFLIFLCSWQGGWKARCCDNKPPKRDAGEINECSISCW